jgi:hypothetical protein
MLKSKILVLILGILLIHGCSGAENEHKSNTKLEVKSSEKSVIIECKADDWNKGDKFTATIEIFPMTKKILNSINFDQKESIVVYAKVKNIEYGKSWKLLKNCQPIEKDSILYSYNIESLKDIGKKYEAELFAKPSEACTPSINITFQDLVFKDTGIQKTYQSVLTREVPYGMDNFDSLFSNCKVEPFKPLGSGDKPQTK